MQSKPLRTTWYIFFGRSEVKVNDRVNWREVGVVQLGTRVVIILYVPVVNQIADDPQFEATFIIQLGVATGAILQAGSGQFCWAVPIEVKNIEDVKITFQGVLFLSLLKENEQALGVFDIRGFQSRTSAASLQLELGCSRFRGIFVDQILSFRCHGQLWDPQFKLSDNDPTSRTVVLKNLFVVILQPKIANWSCIRRQKSVRQFFEEQIALLSE